LRCWRRCHAGSLDRERTHGRRTIILLSAPLLTLFGENSVTAGADVYHTACLLRLNTERRGEHRSQASHERATVHSFTR